ncbi:AAA family ATPase [Paracoccus sanguinis]|uniref:AAA family ATPase n=1 Tax=Paracoccus sanguinis TaxID=1545044 RepID=UPI00051FDC26|nr:AAA family ATPase [Paracoccus sanguinis]KGJ20716.1 hypothetical protein IX55_05155 [Paracoccus sanguinis]
MAEVIPLAKPPASNAAEGKALVTDSERDILRSLQLVSREGFGAITLIAAAPGVGKTHALWEFKHNFRPKAIMHTAVAEEDDTPWGVACQLMETLEIGSPNNRNLRASRMKIADAISPDGMLIVDEAQNLIRRNPRGGCDWSTFEWLRALAEEGCFSLAFSGDLALLDIQQRLPQLWRRMRRRVIIKAVSREDVAIVAAKHGFTDAASVDLLAVVARHGGGLGDVDNTLSHAQLLAGGHKIAAAHVRAALEDLNLMPKGGR